MIINGMQVLTGNLVGAGKTKDVNRLFAGSFLVLTVIFSVFSFVCFVFRQGLSGLLGADGEAYTLLCEYIKGFTPGILPNVLVSMLMAIAPFNNRIKLSYCSLGVIVLISVIAYKKKLDFSVPALLKLPENFGAKEGEFMTFSVEHPDDVTQASEKVIDFCLQHQYDRKTSYHVGLCVEEIAENVLEHGFDKHKKGYCFADMRVVSKGNELTVRVRDNCKEFDPRKRVDMFDPEHPEKNIGIRIVSKAAKNIDYYNNAGINTLIMKF